ncbi:hypothetical protein Val02_06920 [Virgisporangium aliadipatigenens]|uniref:Uncharacterized protein n=1 Tax=Virgisporangium aliadipatigenens TaxID=741659 RepID=A0A8J3YH09_9ACTN|nr:hypothetical protein [Virgisporangium aliadipatigenens]GIJ43806.1 hypothetical protein Val02_06920 [Virgisporangium aliadipatigenens]
MLEFRHENQYVTRWGVRLTGAPDPPTRWFAGEGAVLRVDAGDRLWVRAESADAIAAVRQAFPGDWLMSEPNG